jgi:hypothetical protein
MACCAALAGCGARNAIWLAEPGGPPPVVFRIATQRGGAAPIDYLYGLTVATCGGRVRWTMRNADTDSAARPIRIVYGEAPPGYYSLVPPQPLRPGCYRATVSGPASVEFTVGEDGRAVERGARTADSTARR